MKRVIHIYYIHVGSVPIFQKSTISLSISPGLHETCYIAPELAKIRRVRQVTIPPLKFTINTQCRLKRNVSCDAFLVSAEQNDRGLMDKKGKKIKRQILPRKPFVAEARKAQCFLKLY